MERDCPVFARAGESGRHAAQIPSFGPERREHVPLPVVASPGSEVSRGGLLQDRLVQFRLRKKSFESSVLLLKLFELFGLIDLQATLFTTPAVVGLLGNAKLLANLRGRFSMSEGHLGFSKLVNDLLGSVAFSWHD